MGWSFIFLGSSIQYIRKIFRKKIRILPRDIYTYLCVSGGKACQFFGKLCVRTKCMSPYVPLQHILMQHFCILFFCRHSNNHVHAVLHSIMTCAFCVTGWHLLISSVTKSHLSLTSSHFCMVNQLQLRTELTSSCNHGQSSYY